MDFNNRNLSYKTLNDQALKQQNETCGAIKQPCGGKEPPIDEASLYFVRSLYPDMRRLHQVVVLLHNKVV